MENAIDPPEKVAEDAVNTAAAAAMDTTPPATANDDKTSPSNDDGSARVLVQKKRRTQAELSVSQPKQGTTPSELRGNTTQRKPTTSRPPPLPLHDYKAILRPLGGLRLDQWTRPTLTRAIGVAASLPPAKVDRLVFRLRPEQNLAVGGSPHHTDTGCPARVRPPVNKDRVRKALQQEQQQRDVEQHPTPSSSSQGELQAAGSTPGRKSRSRSRSRRGSRSKARSRTHSRTGSQQPPVKRATTSEATAPLATNQSSLPLKDSNQPNKDQGAGAEQRRTEPRETLASAPQMTQNPDPNALHQRRAEMEAKLRALDARLQREIETACATIRREFRDMLNEAVSALKDTLNNTVATLHTLISNSISTLSTEIQQQTDRNMQQMRQEFAPALTLAPNTERPHPYTRPAPLRSEDGDA
ncbi:hypothetical protein MTO96_046269 [Rhipicephalus appendiculatus]